MVIRNNNQMKKNIVCSVVIPMYNVQRFIENTLNSVLRQTEKRIEIICVDDASTDDTVKVVKQLQKKDKRIILIQNETNMNVSQTRNRGVQTAKSEWIALLDADDMWEENFLEEVLKKKDEKNASMVATSEKFMNDEQVVLGEFIVKDEITYKDLLKQNSVSCSAVLVKKQLLLQNPFYADDVHEDYLCWLSIVKKIGKIYGVEKSVSIRRLTAGSKSRNKLKTIKMSYRTLKKHGVGFFKRCYYTTFNMMNGIKKYRKIKNRNAT